LSLSTFKNKSKSKYVQNVKLHTSKFKVQSEIKLKIRVNKGDL